LQLCITKQLFYIQNSKHLLGKHTQNYKTSKLSVKTKLHGFHLEPCDA